MAYPFESIAHKEYVNTFLVNTTVSLITEDWNGQFKDGFADHFSGFVKRFFGLEKDGHDFIERKELSLKSHDDDVSYSFRPDKVYLRVGRKSYRTFVNSIIPDVLPLKVFLFGVMEKESIENVMVRKLNIFPIQADSLEEIKQNAQKIYGSIFKPAILDSLSQDNPPENTPWILDFRKGIFVDKEDEMAIRIGISQSKGSKNVFNVVLDSSTRCKIPSAIGEGSVDRILLRQNDQLFDAFHWCVSDEIIHLMEKKDPK